MWLQQVIFNYCSGQVTAPRLSHGLPRQKKLLSGTALVIIGTFLVCPPAPADAEESYDLDCAVILCLAGGFPLGCAAAFDHMIDRLTHIPPKSPFGFCSMSDGSKYTDYDAPYRRLSSFDPESWHCADGLKLHHKIKRTDNGRRKVTAFCYESISYQWRGFGEDRHKVTIYNGKQDATPLNFQIQITVDPGTAEQYKSPTYKINTRSGLVVEQQQ